MRARDRYGGVLFARGDRLPLFVDHFSALGGVVFTSVAAYASGSLSLGVAMVYVWTGIFSFLFFTRRVAFSYVGLMAVGYGVVVATAPGNDEALSRWLLVTVGVSVTAVVVSGLIEEIRSRCRAAVRYSSEEDIGRPIDDLVARSDELRDEAAASDRARDAEEIHLVTRRSPRAARG